MQSGFIMRPFVLSFLVAGSAWAQVAARVAPPADPSLQATREAPASLGLIRGPQLGYVFQAGAGTLQPLLGIPEASRLGDALALAVPVSTLSLAPGHALALGVSRDSGEVLLVDLRPGRDPLLQPVPGLAPSPDRILWSPSGTAATLYYQDPGAAWILTGLPETPTLAALELPAPATLLALSDEGLLLARADTSLWALAPSQAPRFLSSFGSVTAAAFLPRSRNAVLGDATGSLVLIRDLPGSAEILTLAGPRDGLSLISAVAASLDGQRIFVADAVSGRIGAIALDGSPARWMDCGCTPSTFDRLRSGAVFALSPPSRGPLLLLDADSAEPRLLLVPPDQPNDSSPPPGDSPPLHAPRTRRVQQ